MAVNSTYAAIFAALVARVNAVCNVAAPAVSQAYIPQGNRLYQLLSELDRELALVNLSSNVI